MADIRPLPLASQAGASDVLHFDAAARLADLYECATHRLDVVRHLMEAMATVQRHDDDRAMPAVASAAALLLSDASGMLCALYEPLRQHETSVAILGAAAQHQCASCGFVAVNVQDGADNPAPFLFHRCPECESTEKAPRAVGGAA